MPRADRTTPDEVCRLEFDVDFPPGHAAAYLLSGEEPILVDAGTLGSAGERDLADGLAAHGYEPADVAHVLLTHRHVDHVGQVDRLREAGDPTVHVPTTFRAVLDRSVEEIQAASRRNLREAGLDAETIDEFLPEFMKAEEIMREVVPATAVDEWITPGETATVGDLVVDPIHTPGHHLTHVCYAADLGDERVLFSGDMAIEPFRALTVHAGLDDGVADGIDAYYRGLDRLDGLPIDRVYPGHGPVHAAFQATIEAAVDGLDSRLAACESSLREGGSTAMHVAGNLAGTDRDGGRMVTEIIAALATLERRNRARSRLDDGVRFYEPV